MLFKEIHLRGIRDGTIHLAFRRWKKPSILVGTLLHTSIGLVEIQHIEIVDEGDITTEDVKKAGYDNKSQLMQSFRNTVGGNIYRIAVRYHSPDPRIELGEKIDLTDQEYDKILMKLSRLDANSKFGKWTNAVLNVIRNNPKKRAIELANMTGFPKEWLKINIRKLKNLGLTISFDEGYGLSLLGMEVLHRIDKPSDKSNK
jgi:hypothetical protein